MLELNLAFQCHLWDVEHHALQSSNLLHQAAAPRICQEILAALQCPLPMTQVPGNLVLSSQHSMLQLAGMGLKQTPNTG